MSGAPNEDVISYESSGSSFKIGIYPRLTGEGFPDLSEITVQCRPGCKAPDKLQFTRGGKSWKEFNGVVYVTYVVGFYGGLLPVSDPQPLTDYQFLALICDKNGKVLKTFTGPGEVLSDDLAEVAWYSFRMWSFEQAAKAMDQKDLPTVIEKVNETDLSHHFSTTIKIPGGGAYSLRKPVSEIRAAKKDLATFQYWQKGWTWPHGDRVAFIGQNWTNAFDIVTYQNGKYLSETIARTWQAAITSASNTLSE